MFVIFFYVCGLFTPKSSMHVPCYVSYNLCYVMCYVIITIHCYNTIIIIFYFKAYLLINILIIDNPKHDCCCNLPFYHQLSTSYH